MRIPKQIEADNVDGLRQILHAFSFGMGLCEDIRNFGGRYLKGGITEMVIVENYLCRTYSPYKVKWDKSKVESQLYNKPDGIPDWGWDAQVDGMKIDIKWDATLRNGQVCLALFTGHGTPQLLKKTDANTSVQVYLSRRELNAVQRHLGMPEFTLKLMWIDLDKLRSDMVEKNGKYCIGLYREETIYRNGDRVLRLPVSFLNGKYGRLDVIRA